MKDYKEALNQNNIQSLRKIAKQWDIPYISGYKKQALLEKLMDEMEDHLEDKLSMLRQGHIDMLLNLESVENFKGVDPISFQGLKDKGLLLNFNDQWLTHPNVKNFIQPMAATLGPIIETNTVITFFIETFTAFYGMIEKKTAINLIHDLFEKKLSVEIIEKILNYSVEGTRNTFEDNGYYHDHRLHEIDKRVEVIKTSQSLEYYPISSEDFERYAKTNYIYNGQSFEDFTKLLFPKYTTSMYETIDLLDQLNLMLLYGYQPSDYMKFIANTFKITDGKALKEVADACMNFYNDMPQWYLKGYSPNQFMSKAQKTVIKKEKVGRNDPCPCGSHKKYKQCCLNKERSQS